METAIVVFTRDLRVHDNPALAMACARAERVLPVFVLDAALLTSPNRTRFLLDSLADLREGLRERGGDLIVRRGEPVSEVLRLAAATRAQAIFIADDVSRYAARRRSRLAAGCASQRIELTVTPGLTVVPPGALRPAGGDHYKVFTPYWRAWIGAEWRAAVPAPAAVRLPSGLSPGPIPADGGGTAPGLMRGGELAARARALGLAARLAELLWRPARRPGRRPDLPAERLPAVRLPVAARAGGRDAGAARAARSSAGSSPGATSSIRPRRPSRTWRGRTTGRGAAAGATTRRPWRRGATGAPACRSWTPGCGSWPPRASCTTGPG